MIDKGFSGELNAGFVYAVEFPGGRVKVGRTKDPKTRLRALCSQSGYKVDEVNHFFGRTARHDEVELKCHRDLSKVSDRLAGEYFDCPFDVAVDVIEGNCIPYSFKDEVADKDAARRDARKFVDDLKRVLTLSACDFDLFSIGGAMRDEILSVLEPVGGSLFYNDMVRKYGCLSLVIVSDFGVYSLYPGGCDKFDNLDAYIHNFNGSKKDVADDLGVSEDDVGSYDDFMIDIRDKAKSVGLNII